jgi:serine/threonine protein kinase
MGLTLGEEIGHGTYGHVFQGFDSKGKEVAIKCYKVDNMDEGIDVGILREIVYLKSLPGHANIIALDEIDWVGNRLRVSMPLYKTDLRKFVKSRVKKEGSVAALSYAEIISFSRQILKGLEHLHKHGISARDVKPANILLNPHITADASGPGNRLTSRGRVENRNGNIDETAQLVLCDFSLASNMCTKLDHSTTIQTLWYRAIEVLLGSKNYDTGIDIWSFGCVLGFMMNGKDIMRGDCEYGQTMKIFQIIGTPTAQDWPEIVNLPHYNPDWPKFTPKTPETIFQNCRHNPRLDALFSAALNPNPKRRCTARQALEML